MRLAALACTLLVAASAGAAPGAEEDAAAHYEAGKKLHADGRFDEAIAEFEQAYRIKPHPNVLFSMALGYERLLEYAKSVNYFELYLHDAPDGEFRTVAENRLRVLRNLPARLSISTIPERVHVRISGKGGTFEGDTPRVFKVPAGDWTVELSQNGWEREKHTMRLDIGQPYFNQYRLKRSTAQVTIFTRPRGARVFIDDKLVGETPFAEEVEVGRHKLMLEHPDYPWHRQELVVEQQKPVKLEIKLQRPIRSGRTELVIAAMLYGGIAGPMIVAAAATNTDFVQSGAGLGTLLGASAAGIGAGFLGAFLTTKEGIKVGHSSLIIGGGAWGTTFGASLAMGLQISNQYIFGLGLLGGALGIATGALVSKLKDTSAGGAALVNTGGIWGTAAGALLTQAIFQSPGIDQFGWFMLGGVTIGVTTGSLLAWKLELSRMRVFLIDVGGLVGTGLGFGIGSGVGASSGDDIVQSGARFALGGLALGLVAAAVGTRNYKSDIAPSLAIAPREPYGFKLALPSIRMEEARLPEGVDRRVLVDVFRGTW
jgi:hypothetical protein